MKATERETTVSYADDGRDVQIYTCIRRDITAMKKKGQFILTEEGTHVDGTPYAYFTIPRDKFDIARAAKSTRTMTDEAKQKLAERLASSRSKKKDVEDE